MNTYFPIPTDCSPQTIFPGVEIRTFWGEKMMVSLVDMQPHAVVEEHQHPHEQVGTVLAGKAIFTVGGVEKTLKKGDCYNIPGNVRHKVVALEDKFQAVDVFSPPREEYKK